MKKVTGLKFNNDGTGFWIIFDDASNSELQTSFRMGMKTMVKFSNEEIDKETYFNITHKIIKATAKNLAYFEPQKKKKK